MADETASAHGRERNSAESGHEARADRHLLCLTAAQATVLRIAIA